MDDNEVEDMMEKIKTAQPRIDKECSGMTYVEGIIAALEWFVGDLTDDELLNI